MSFYAKICMQLISAKPCHRIFLNMAMARIKCNVVRFGLISNIWSVCLFLIIKNITRVDGLNVVNVKTLKSQ